MIGLGTRRNGELRRRPIPVLDATYFKAEWMESGTDPQLSPTVSLIEQPPEAVLVPHFHRQNQFQLFVEGGGFIGSTVLAPLTIHYAGAFTGYGPVVAGPQGVKYFTMRAVCESGLVPISEAREKMVRGPKRHAQAGPLSVATPSELRALESMTTQPAIPMADDGLGAEIIRCPRAGTLAVSRHPASEGLFVVVLAGALEHDGVELTPWESLFVTTANPLPRLTAGKDGVEVVVLHAPRKAAAYS